MKKYRPKATKFSASFKPARKRSFGYKGISSGVRVRRKFGPTWVRAYFRRDGTFVRGHTRDQWINNQFNKSNNTVGFWYSTIFLVIFIIALLLFMSLLRVF